MNVQKFTQKSMEAIQLAQNIATEHDNQQIEQCHILLALLMQENGLVPQLLTKMGITVPSFISAAQELVAQLPDKHRRQELMDYATAPEAAAARI